MTIPRQQLFEGNTLSSPKFTEDGSLKKFDYVVANPPFSDKRWLNGLDPETDPSRTLQVIWSATSEAG